MSLKYRKKTESGDYSFGNGPGDFLHDNDAVRQACVTRLELWLETWWRDLTDGTPFMQKILASRGSVDNLKAIGELLQGRILGTRDVKSVTGLLVQYDQATRKMILTGTVTTVYSTFSLELELN